MVSGVYTLIRAASSVASRGATLLAALTSVYSIGVRAQMRAPAMRTASVPQGEDTPSLRKRVGFYTISLVLSAEVVAGRAENKVVQHQESGRQLRERLVASGESLLLRGHGTERSRAP